VDDRDTLKQFLEDNSISCNIHYPQTFYQSEAFSELNGLTFKADSVKQRLLSLPMYPELPNEDVMQVCMAIKKFYS
jgi:dTDP-4-amino-4,6-dideoxygalactose transaminase